MAVLLLISVLKLSDDMELHLAVFYFSPSIKASVTKYYGMTTHTLISPAYFLGITLNAP